MNYGELLKSLTASEKAMLAARLTQAAMSGIPQTADKVKGGSDYWGVMEKTQRMFGMMLKFVESAQEPPEMTRTSVLREQPQSQ